ncbi:MAG: PDZ domain-containing protein [Actinobacteria bacterium]|nr:PDZ domain-containing protein [Actinomycetota bacterium]
MEDKTREPHDLPIEGGAEPERAPEALPAAPPGDPAVPAPVPDPAPGMVGPLPAEPFAAVPPDPPRPSVPRQGRRYALVGLTAGALGAALTAGAFLLWFDRGRPVEVVQRVETRIVRTEAAAVGAAAVAQAVLPSIVTVEVSSAAAGDFIADGSGSGVVLRADGLLVTNEHVVAGAARVRVIFAGGRAYPAEVVGEDAATDLAVLRIAASGLTPVTLGSSVDLEIGDPAIAIGSPLGLAGGPSVTVGVVSAFDRQLRTGANEYLYGLIQTDAPITRGSSGGALVDARGRLIGITAAIGISDVGAEGLGFAIPVELVSIVTEQLIARGEADHPFLGIEGRTFFRQEDDGSTVPAGVAVVSVIAGTAAAAAGIQAGDIILSVGGEPLATMERLVVLLRFQRVGEIVELQVEREGAVQAIPVSLMERPEGV